jgi:hypothetical protein
MVCWLRGCLLVILLLLPLRCSSWLTRRAGDLCTRACDVQMSQQMMMQQQMMMMGGRGGGGRGMMMPGVFTNVRACVRVFMIGGYIYTRFSRERTCINTCVRSDLW